MFTVESAAVAELKVKDRKRYEYICRIERGKLTFECRISIFTIDSAEKEDTWIKF